MVEQWIAPDIQCGYFLPRIYLAPEDRSRFVISTKEGIAVTGASGFIGTHLCNLVRKNARIIAIDKVEPGVSKDAFQKIDLSRELPSLDGINVVYHLAANPEVRIGSSDTSVDYENNIVATRNVLESLRKSRFHGTFVFASTSTVYGEASVMPTPENYGPLIPISMYGASKLACESLISAYAKLFGFRARIIRFANVVGGSSSHGVVCDFVNKLKKNPRKLEILGDGTQKKSYVHISDCAEGIMKTSGLGGDVEIFNLGTEQTTDVMRIASIVAEELSLEDVEFETGHGSGEGGRGWPGDVKNMLLDSRKLISFGWKYHLTSDEAIRETVREMIR